MQSAIKERDQIEAKDLVGFLFCPSESHDAVERFLTSSAIAELESLDSYLESIVGDAWIDSKNQHGLVLHADSWTALWPTRLAARLVLIEREKANPAWRTVLLAESNPLRVCSFNAGPALTRNIVSSGGFLDLELSRTFHPSTVGASVYCEKPSGERLDDLTSRYRIALDCLARHDPTGLAVFTQSVNAIAPLALDPQLEAGKSFSMSIGTAPGLVLLTITSEVLLAETLLHESAHNRLSAIDGVARLWRPGSVRVKSPLRSDARPISGLYHQSYVLYHLCRYYNLLMASSGDPEVERNRRQIEKRYGEFTTGFRAAVETLRANESELTPLGILVLDEIAKAVTT